MGLITRASPRLGSSGWPLLTMTARFSTAPTPRMPTCGWTMTGVWKRLPEAPVCDGEGAVGEVVLTQLVIAGALGEFVDGRRGPSG